MTDTKAGVSCAMQEDEFHLLYPPGHAPATHNAMQNYDFVHTLQIDQMIGIKRESYPRHPGSADRALFQLRSGGAALSRRCDLGICRERAAAGTFAGSPADDRDVYEMRRVLHHGDGSLESGLSSTRYIEQYLELMALFGTRLQPVNPQSEGVRRLKSGRGCTLPHAGLPGVMHPSERT